MTSDVTTELNNPIIVSDLLLREDRPKTLLGFLRFLDSVAIRYSELVILGNLFDEWMGVESLNNSMVETVVAQLKVLTTAGQKVYVMPGDKDMMLGEEFEAATGVQIVPDPWCPLIKGQPVLLSHGDHWLLNDKAHMMYREMTARRAWRDAFAVHDLQENLENLEEMKVRAQEAAMEVIKPTEEHIISDQVVLQAIREHGAVCAIHGHTKDMGAHINSRMERWTLPHWDMENPEEIYRGYIAFKFPGRPQLHMI